MARFDLDDQDDELERYDRGSGMFDDPENPFTDDDEDDSVDPDEFLEFDEKDISGLDDNDLERGHELFNRDMDGDY